MNNLVRALSFYEWIEILQFLVCFGLGFMVSKVREGTVNPTDVDAIQVGMSRVILSQCADGVTDSTVITVWPAEQGT